MAPPSADKSGPGANILEAELVAFVGGNLELIAEGEEQLTAADLSCGLFSTFAGRPLGPWSGFQNLEVLVLAGSRLQVSTLSPVLRQCPQLEKLDISRCSLKEIPGGDMWAQLTCLRTLYVHRNELKNWDDLNQVLETPALNWLTFFDNPIASQPEYRTYAISRQRQLLALDHWTVVDTERLDGDDLRHNGRVLRKTGYDSVGTFSVCSSASILNVNNHAPPSPFSPEELMKDHRKEQWALRTKSNTCSAVHKLQSIWRGFFVRERTQAAALVKLRAIVRIQRRVKTFLWRRQMVAYVKEYLAEIDQLDLLLSAQEMHKLRAAKLITKAVKGWLLRRVEQRKFLKASMLLGRCARGFTQRRQLIRNHLELGKYLRIYVPEQFAWEFMVLLNMAREKAGLPKLDKAEAFQPADMIGVRIPEMDQVPKRSASIMSIVSFGQQCIVRPLRTNRFANHSWDGPMHRIIDTRAPPKIQKAFKTICRRAANVDNRCRRAFLQSCCPMGEQHPIDEIGFWEAAANAKPEDQNVSLPVTRLLEKPESELPPEARKKGTVLHSFLKEARRIGSRPRRPRAPMDRTISPKKAASQEATRNYSKTCWISQRLLVHQCENERLVLTLLVMLLQFGRSLDDMPLLKAVPFLLEKPARQISAAVVIQSSWRGHLERVGLACGLKTAIVLRRASLCIQRAWRWGILKRRLELLSGAARYLRAVDTNCLYMEERLLSAFNIISMIDRYPPLIQERSLGFGYCTEEESVVLVRDDLKGLKRPTTMSRKMNPKKAENYAQRERERDGGLPMWFMELLPEMPALGPDAESLECVNGPQGLVLKGLGERTENHIVTVSMASLQHSARLAQETEEEEGLKTSALAASGGSFRFVELKFSSLAQAKRRAMLVFLCSFSAQQHVAVPLLTAAQLQKTSTIKNILSLWDMYGLTWPEGDRATAYSLKLRGRKDETVSRVCGTQSMYATIKAGERPAERKPAKGRSQAGGHALRKEQRAEATGLRYAAFADQVSSRKRQDVEELVDACSPMEMDHLQDGRAPGALEVRVAGAIPPMTASRAESEPAAMARADKAAAKEMAMAGRAQELEHARAKREAVLNSKGQGENAAAGFEEKIYAFHAKQAETERREAERMKLAALEKDSKEQKKESVRLKKQAKAHKAAEARLVERSERVAKLGAQDDEQAARDAQLDWHDQQKQEAKEHTREEVSRAKMEKANRQDATSFAAKLVASTHRIQKAAYKADLMVVRERDAIRGADRLGWRKEIWASRTMLLAERKHQCVQLQKKQVADLKTQIQNLTELQRQDEERDVQEKHTKVSAQYQLEKLMRAARQEIDAHSADGVTPAVAASYARTLQAFRDLAEHVGEGLAAVQASLGNKDGLAGAAARLSRSMPPPLALAGFAGKDGLAEGGEAKGASGPLFSQGPARPPRPAKLLPPTPQPRALAAMQLPRSARCGPMASGIHEAAVPRWPPLSAR